MGARRLHPLRGPGRVGPSGIQRIAADGGVLESLTRIDTVGGEYAHRAPRMLPDRKALIYGALGRGANGPFARLMIRPAGGGAARVLLEGVILSRYLDDGRLVYQRGNDLLVADLDRSSLTVTNEHRLLKGVAEMAMDVGVDGAAWALSDDLLVYGSATTPTRSLAWVDRAGRTEQLPARPGSYAEITLSPDGLRASLGIFVGLRSDIWIYDLGQEVLTPVTTDGLTIGGIWAPDAQHHGKPGRRQPVRVFANARWLRSGGAIGPEHAAALAGGLDEGRASSGGDGRRRHLDCRCGGRPGHPSADPHARV